MVKKVNLEGVIEGLTQEMAEQMMVAAETRKMPIINLAGINVAGVDPMKLGTFNEREMASVKALICYAAANNNLTEDALRAIVADRFERILVEDIPSAHYERVIEYLVDFKNSVN
ncbi:MAG: hypothetical protein KGI37_07630 [Alphaproteobacteria bacterium]|nr:hypothetical protein [Alphaproteobacteria bacterium]